MKAISFEALRRIQRNLLLDSEKEDETDIKWWTDELISRAENEVNTGQEDAPRSKDRVLKGVRRW